MGATFLELSCSAAAAAKSLQSCPTLHNPIDGSQPGSSVPGILQARILEWVAISFSNACMHAKSLQSCPTLWDPMDSSPPGSSVHRILQARILEWVAISFSSSSPQQINLARVFWRPFTGGTWEGALESPAVRLQTQAVKWDRENLPGRLWQDQASLDPDLKRWRSEATGLGSTTQTQAGGDRQRRGSLPTAPPGPSTALLPLPVWLLRQPLAPPSAGVL